MTTVVGIISDTHGLLRPEAKAVLKACDEIVHAGDIGKPEVLDELKAIAPLTAIRGNIDRWATDLPTWEVLQLEARSMYILHDIAELDLDPQAAGFEVVISGHSHRAGIHVKDGVLYLNPGSAGPKRFTLPVTLALLELSADRLDPRIVELAT